MARLDPAPAAQYEALFGRDAPLRQRVYAQRPELARSFAALGDTFRKDAILPGRLLELVRLRVAFHNQCRSCMAVRYGHGLDDGLTEDLVCSLEKPEEAPDLTDRERAAIAYADLMATNHHAASDETFAMLKEHFTQPEIMELCFNVAMFVGFGRMAMSLDLTDDLPEGFKRHGVVTPWEQDEVIEVAVASDG